MFPFRYSFGLLLIAIVCRGYPRQVISDNPEETGGYFEGDIILSPDQLKGIQSKNGLIAKSKRWPNKLVTYKISPDFDNAHQAHIKKAIQTIEDVSCIRFQEADETTKYYINIVAVPDGCHSQVGYQQSIQRMNLQIYPIDEGCFRLGTILHEFLHTLGFYHQQSASDRDDFITVVEENIEPGMEHNFKKFATTENFGIPYDYKSVLHYTSSAFSKNGENTIRTHDPNAVIGQRNGLSSKDIDKLNTMYLCPMQI